MFLQKSIIKSNLFMIIINLILIVMPFVYSSRSVMVLFTHIFIFAVLAMSYDILLGYTGIVSFGHSMFFGIGAYCVAIFMGRFGNSLEMLLLAVVTAVFIAALLSYVVGILSLRLKSHFYAMLTLAFSGLLLVVAEKWRSLTAGNEGFTFAVPDILKDRMVLYYVAFVVMIVVFLILRRFTVSPLGKVLQATRENEERTQSLGYEIVHYKVIATIVSGIMAALSGALYIITLRFVNTTVLSMDITLNALLMVVIGGVGTLYGGILGSAIIELVQNGLSGLAKTYPIFERWIIFIGLMYIVVVLLFPAGIVGTMGQWLHHRKRKKIIAQSEMNKKNAGSEVMNTDSQADQGF